MSCLLHKGTGRASTALVRYLLDESPYGKTTRKWLEKASQVALQGKATVVCLVPARTDTRWFHDLIYNKPNVEVTFVKGRLKFVGAKNSAPFPSMVVVFNAT